MQGSQDRGNAPHNQQPAQPDTPVQKQARVKLAPWQERQDHQCAKGKAGPRKEERVKPVACNQQFTGAVPDRDQRHGDEHDQDGAKHIW